MTAERRPSLHRSAPELPQQSPLGPSHPRCGMVTSLPVAFPPREKPLLAGNPMGKPLLPALRGLKSSSGALPPRSQPSPGLPKPTLVGRGVHMQTTSSQSPSPHKGMVGQALVQAGSRTRLGCLHSSRQQCCMTLCLGRASQCFAPAMQSTEWKQLPTARLSWRARNLTATHKWSKFDMDSY